MLIPLVWSIAKKVQTEQAELEVTKVNFWQNIL
jgi:hypothetical protein